MILPSFHFQKVMKKILGGWSYGLKSKSDVIRHGEGQIWSPAKSWIYVQSGTVRGFGTAGTAEAAALPCLLPREGKKCPLLDGDSEGKSALLSHIVKPNFHPMLTILLQLQRFSI